MTSRAAAPPRSTSWKRVVLDAAATVLLSVLLAAGVNLLRQQPLAWVQSVPYDILVPCPEVTGDATEVPATSPLVSDAHTFLIDVRTASEFDTWHVGNARNQPFDWLGPPADSEAKAIAREVARTGMRQVVVYGDGGDPDSGREWARILAGARLKNVHYVAGGAPALRGAQNPGSAQ